MEKKEEQQNVELLPTVRVISTTPPKEGEGGMKVVLAITVLASTRVVPKARLEGREIFAGGIDADFEAIELAAGLLTESPLRDHATARGRGCSSEKPPAEALRRIETRVACFDR